MVAPKLRFDGFDSDWTLDSIGAVISNKSKKYDPEKSEIDFPCIELEHLSQQTDEILGTVSAKDQKSIKYVFDENSVLFGKLRPYLRKFAKPEFQGVCSSEIWVLTSKKMQPNFLFQYVQTDGFSELTQIQAGSKMPRADWGSISNGEILFPIFEEQTKIASFLSAVDEKISQLTQKLHLLSQYKQGMMQKLFSQQIRFKADDGSEFGEWKKTEIKNISKIFDGTHQTPNYVIAGVPFYSVEHVTANNFKNTKYIAEDVYLAELKRVQLEKGDILLTRIGDIGTCKLIDWDVRASFYVSLALIKVNKQHSSSFVNQYIKSNLFQKELHERTIHVAFPKKINLGEIGLCLIQLPCLEEQTKIANFLSAIDQKIDVVSEQLEQAKLWKKGLLQQMFV